MKRIRPFLCLTFVAAWLLPTAGAQEDQSAREEAPGKKEAVEATEFIRIDENDKATRLQTSVTRYGKDGVTVDLIGAVHIGDKKYYADLNKSFEKYDALLFEMVGGEDMVEGRIPKQEEGGGDFQTNFLRGMVDGMSRFLKLSSQMQEIDYSPKNFVHADLTMKQFQQKQEANGESLFNFALAAAQQAQNQGVEQPNPARLIAALLSGNSNGLKLEMMKSLGQGDDQIAAFAGNSVIIGDRNAKCLRVLRKQVRKKGRRNIGIFYGAAHNPDLEARLLKRGYRKGKQEWMTAWDVPKDVPKPVDDGKKAEEGETEKAVPRSR